MTDSSLAGPPPWSACQIAETSLVSASLLSCVASPAVSTLELVDAGAEEVGEMKDSYVTTTVTVTASGALRGAVVEEVRREGRDSVVVGWVMGRLVGPKS